MLGAAVDVYLNQAKFSHQILECEDGTEFARFNVMTPYAALTLIPYAGPVSYEDTQTAIALAQAADRFRAEVIRLYQHQQGIQPTTDEGGQ